MKLYVRIALAVFITILGWGIVGPNMVSADSNILVILGFIISFILMPYLLYYVLLKLDLNRIQ